MTHYLLGAVVNLWRHLRKLGTSSAERGRQRSIEAMTAPLHHQPIRPDERLHVAAIHAIWAETRTAERPLILDTRPPVRRRVVQRPPSQRQLAAMRARVMAPVQQFHDDPLTAPLPAAVTAAEPELFDKQVEHWMSRTLPFVPTEPFALEGPSREFPRGWINEILAGAR